MNQLASRSQSAIAVNKGIKRISSHGKKYNSSILILSKNLLATKLNKKRSLN
jgi:hypothetical protein